MIYNFAGFAIDANTVLYLGIGLGVLLVFMGLYLGSVMRDPVADRMRATAQGYTKTSDRKALMKTMDKVPEGILKALIPEDRSERTQIRFRLRQAGFDGPDSVRNFFVFRLVTAMIVPFLALLFFSVREIINVPTSIDAYLNTFTKIQVMQILAVSVALGFYGPTYWLHRQIKARQLEIEQGFPNALDLLQISSEAGLAFDTAMTRVAQNLANICPAISEEFLMCQAEVLAGRHREQALSDMAERMGIEEVNAFVALIIQSMEYGTSISDALIAYALEMRETRELKAQEKANKLPVQMSGVMASLMLPALFLITLGPTIIRYMDLYK
ncbi:tight adherence protein C [Litoreibacter ponti]|uniref:Tight adherence protein C n=1 Tax=Litoreibacter ponti TaxID=1510457 RepID=A0A2T6BF12_9RHOB|nr:type II secretion system F family protein [Litoreibacter ponti]PTX54644.1 tight adherence protein C [Litoreibacter ponti]